MSYFPPRLWLVWSWMRRRRGRQDEPPSSNDVGWSIPGCLILLVGVLVVFAILCLLACTACSSSGNDTHPSRQRSGHRRHRLPAHAGRCTTCLTYPARQPILQVFKRNPYQKVCEKAHFLALQQADEEKTRTSHQEIPCPNGVFRSVRTGHPPSPVGPVQCPRAIAPMPSGRCSLP
jgi:hypothetical protein